MVPRGETFAACAYQAMKPPAAIPPLGIGKALNEVRSELSRRPRLPPGETGFSLRRTHELQRHTLQVLLGCYERFGPFFTFRSLHRPVVAMIGPAANHFVTVSGAGHFSWRRGMFGEQLTPLIGDGLITTDWEYHDRARQIMMPAFHRRRMDAAVAVMNEETDRALNAWGDGRTVDVYEWIRELAMSIAMRALVGLDPHDVGIGREAAVLFEAGLRYYDAEIWTTLLRGPGTPWAKMQAARRGLDRIIFSEIERRRSSGVVGEDVLSMLLEARDAPDDSGAAQSGEAGCRAGGRPEDEGFTPVELRDQLMHLLFGGHDTSSSTVSFLFYELGRNPHVLDAVVDELDSVLGGRAPSAAELIDSLPLLSRAVDETLRLYPPVWFGPRMAVKPFSFGGYDVPAGTHIIHSAWVSHRLPEVFPNPDAFVPERFAPGARTALPPGAYIPFGAGRRVCIGKRFGQLVVKAVAAGVLQRFRCEGKPGFELHVAKVPTLSPEGGLPMTVHVKQRDRGRDTVPLRTRG
jgi:cytochrome P450